MRQTRSRTKAARTQAAPSCACTSTSKTPSSSSSEESEERDSISDSGLKKQILGWGRGAEKVWGRRTKSVRLHANSVVPFLSLLW